MHLTILFPGSCKKNVFFYFLRFLQSIWYFRDDNLQPCHDAPAIHCVRLENGVFTDNITSWFKHSLPASIFNFVHISNINQHAGIGIWWFLRGDHRRRWLQELKRSDLTWVKYQAGCRLWSISRHCYSKACLLTIQYKCYVQPARLEDQHGGRSWNQKSRKRAR